MKKKNEDEVFLVECITAPWRFTPERKPDAPNVKDILEVESRHVCPGCGKLIYEFVGKQTGHYTSHNFVRVITDITELKEEAAKTVPEELSTV